jgi:hypothetical protein
MPAVTNRAGFLRYIGMSRQAWVRLSSICVVLLVTVVTLYLVKAGGQRPAAGLAPTPHPTRLLPQLPDQQFLHDRIGLNVTPVDAGSVRVAAIGAPEAEGIALRHEAAGSSSEGTVLAQVQNIGSGTTCVCWIVAIHPSAPLPANSPSDTRASNFDFHIIDAMTGFAYGHYSGFDPSLPAYR